jgi:hypothetical protein
MLEKIDFSLDGRQVRHVEGISSELTVGSGLLKTYWMKDRLDKTEEFPVR